MYPVNGDQPGGTDVTNSVMMIDILVLAVILPLNIFLLFFIFKTLSIAQLLIFFFAIFCFYLY